MKWLSDRQLGKKFGRHKNPNLQGYRTPEEYRQLAIDIYNDPAATRVTYGADDPHYAGETHIFDGNNVLRLEPEGNFRCLYPFGTE